MPENLLTNDQVCVVIGASHAGVNFAFSLRNEGWQGDIILFDSDPMLPYHRPPLSKGYLSGDETMEQDLLKPAESYEKERISLRTGVFVSKIDPQAKTITLGDGSIQAYSKLVIATGARPIVPPIRGIDTAKNIFVLRTAADAFSIRNELQSPCLRAASEKKRVIVIGGGYIGLETAASLRKLGAEVTVLEREERILARITAPVMSAFFHDLHQKNGVEVLTGKNVIAIETNREHNVIWCDDDSHYIADMIVLGAGIQVNKDLAEQAGLEIENGIRVNSAARTSDEDIYAIGDCTFHHNPHYDRFVRLESVQNAVDQAKVAAAAIMGKQPVYNTVPWFWSDQYDIKLQMVGLSTGYNQALVRKETGDSVRFSVWYFNDDNLLAVDAINNGKAYVLGTKFIKERQKINKAHLIDSTVEFKPGNLVVE